FSLLPATASLPPSTPFPSTTLFRSIFVLDIAHLAHRGAAFNRHASHLARRHAQLRVLAFLGQQLRERSGRACHLSAFARPQFDRSEEHTSELQSRGHLVCRLLPEKK